MYSTSPGCCSVLQKVRLMHGPLKPEEAVESFQELPLSAQETVYNRDGTLLAVVTPAGVNILDAHTGERVCHCEQTGIHRASFSPQGTFLQTWHKKKDDEPNLVIWRVSEGVRCGGFFQKSPPSMQWPVLHWTDDELLACKCVTGEVQFFRGDDLGGKVVGRAVLPGVRDASLAPGPVPRLATFTPASSRRPGAIMLFNYPKLDVSDVVASRSAFDVDHCEFHWSPDGRSLLALFSTDTSSNSYYGDTKLSLFSSDGKIEQDVPLAKEGVIHDVQWSPNSRDFIVIAGRSPPAATLFTASCEPVFDFGIASRNTILWSPHGRFICLAGYGNMAGGMSFWDRNKLKLMGDAEASGTTYAEWSPCGRYFMTATTHPRLRVDNGFKMWTHRGDGPVASVDIDVAYAVHWRPAPEGVYPDRPQSPPRARSSAATGTAGAGGGAAAKRTGVYRPPHATGLVSAMMRSERMGAGGGAPRRLGPGQGVARAPSDADRVQQAGLPLGAAPPGAEPATKKKSKAARQRENKKRRLQEEQEAEQARMAATSASSEMPPDPEAPAASPAPAAAAATPSSTVAPPPAATLDTETLGKEIGKVEKKLNQIQKLRDKEASGTALNQQQQRKVETEPELRRWLEDARTYA